MRGVHRLRLGAFLVLWAWPAAARPVVFTSDPGKVNVYLDGSRAYRGAKLGQTQSGVETVWDLPDGRHLIQATWPGWAVWHRYLVVCQECPNQMHIDMFYRVRESFGLSEALQVGGSDRPIDGRVQLLLHDFNEDGLDDLLIADSSARLWIAMRRLVERQVEFDGLALVGRLPRQFAVGHVSPFLIDWDNDGRIDLLVGTDLGFLLRLESLGEHLPPGGGAGGLIPDDLPGEMLRDAEGYPIKVAGEAQPWGIDWDGNGAKDLLVLGRSEGTIRLFLNSADDAAPRLEDSGYLLDIFDRPLRLTDHPSIYGVDIDYDLVQDLIAVNDKGVFLYVNRKEESDAGGGLFSPVGIPIRVFTNKDGTVFKPETAGLVPPYAINFTDFILDRRFQRDLLITDATGRLLLFQAMHLVGDANNDRQVQGLDLIQLNRALGTCKGQPGFDAEVDLAFPSPTGDLQESQCVDAQDRDGLLRQFGRHFTPCGNGLVEPGEECDDGNRIELDGCSEACLSEPD